MKHARWKGGERVRTKADGERNCERRDLREDEGGREGNRRANEGC